MSHEQMLLDKYHKMVDNANNEAWKVEELEKKNKELLVSKNALYKEVEEMVTERDTLKKENKKLKEERHKVIQDAYQSHYDTWKAEQENIVITELKEENKKLEEVITELKEEIEDLEEELNDKKLLMVSDGVGGVVNVREIMKQMDICRFVKEQNDKLEEDNKKLKECLLGYWSEGMLGNTEAWTHPATWQTMLEKANDAN
jgi:DNA repair exonuclease SbcCD ATPase subunit